jgi:hypothetical protein
MDHVRVTGDPVSDCLLIFGLRYQEGGTHTVPAWRTRRQERASFNLRVQPVEVRRLVLDPPRVVRVQARNEKYCHISRLPLMINCLGHGAGFLAGDGTPACSGR